MECLAVEQISTELVHGCLIVNDGTTKPGYVKLRIIINRIPITSNIAEANTDQYGRVCVCSNIRPWESMDDIPMLDIRQERRGPAVTGFGRVDLPDIDRVYAFRCYGIPSFTIGWIRRPRKYGWPSEQLLDKMSSYGCFLVGKGHPSSQTEHLEWRISFSFQERELMFSLNSTQHKCYILMKMIKQYIVSKLKIQSVSSHHLKTSLFYTIENNPTHIWIPDNIVYCTELCLKQLLDWLNNENCPNFFLPEENMFDRLSSDVMKMAATFIQEMLDSDGQYLMLLTCDKFRELLQESLSGKVLADLSHDVIEFDFNIKLNLSMGSIYIVNRLATSVNRNCASETLSALKLLLEHIKKSEEKLVSEKVFTEIKQSNDILLTTIHLQIAQTTAAIMLTVTDADTKRELMRDFDHHIEQTNGFDIVSQRLVKASLLFKENRLEECARILEDCELSLQNYLISTCSCRYTTSRGHEFENWIRLGNTASMSPLEFHKTCVTSCLKFLPCQYDLAPSQLCYEMYRSVGASTDTIHPLYHNWFRVIAIDAKLYLFLLQYLVYLKEGEPELAERAQLKLSTFINETLFERLTETKTRKGIGHLETGLNMLGLISKHDKNSEFAAHCFITSWMINQITTQLNGTCL